VSIPADEWVARIGALKLPRKIKIMNVCGGHERTVSMSGLRSVLPAGVELIPGPGCPVCVCPEEDIHDAIRIALERQVILLAFGDMLRVPAAVSKGELRTLEQARSAGADVRPVASPLEAAMIARANTDRPVIFFAAGFETTTAPVAAMLLDSPPPNLFVLLSARRTWPAVAMLLESDQPAFDALLAPGHVSAIMGADEWRFVVERHAMPVAVAGFTPESLLAATYSVLRQIAEHRRFLDNCYGQVVRPDGNAMAQQALRQAMDIVDAQWRGIGVIPRSGFRLKPELAAHDARLHFPVAGDIARKRAGQMPPGCDCAKVVLGKIYPDQCRLYGRACTPRAPVGPCMVSDEGACRIWWANRRRETASTVAEG
jgi:hydrogenase expression/formation protein HypD